MSRAISLVTTILIVTGTIFSPVSLEDALSADNGVKEMTPIPMISGIEMLKVGEKAPDFSVPDLSGKNFSISDSLKDKKCALLVFWSIFCEPCKAEMPIIQEITEEYSEKGVQVVGVAIDGVPMKGAISAFIKQEKFTFKVLIDQLNPDESFVISDPYGVAGTPTLYVIDSQRIVRFARVGRTTKEKLVEVLDSIL